jgi:hypothetical protein
MVMATAAVPEDAVTFDYSKAPGCDPVRLVIRKINVKSREY